MGGGTLYVWAALAYAPFKREAMELMEWAAEACRQCSAMAAEVGFGADPSPLVRLAMSAIAPCSECNVMLYYALAALEELDMSPLKSIVG